MTNDPLGALLTTLRNGVSGNAPDVVVEQSKLNAAVLKVLFKNRFVGEFEPVKIQGHQFFKVQLKNSTITPIHVLKRISRPGLRRYSKARDIPTPVGGYGMVILTTPKGVMSGQEARKLGLGGELICEVS